MEEGAVHRIVSLAEQREPIVEAPDFRDTRRYYVRTASGSYEEHFAANPRDAAMLFDTGSFAALANSEATDNRVEVYYSSNGIQAYIYDGEKSLYRTHDLPLNRHPVFGRLERLARTETFDQRGLIRLLRAEFNGHVSDSVIEQFRQLRLTSSDDGVSVVAKGREGVDRSIQRKVQDERGGEIPDEIEVTVPVFDLDEVRNELYSVTVLVDVINDGNPVFELTAVHNDLRQAEQEAVDQIFGNLSDALSAGIPTYYGRI